MTTSVERDQCGPQGQGERTMSFSLTFHGHAGPGMPANGQEEMTAVQDVVRATREAFEAHRLNLGKVTCSPPEWLTLDLTIGQYLTDDERTSHGAS